MAASFGPRVARTRDGRFRIRLGPEERAILRELPGQLRAILGTDDPSLRRLFPPAYEDDPARSAEFDRLVREDLLARHRGHLDVLAATVGADSLDEEQLEAWLGALNGLRLTLGTRLDVTEELYDVGIPEPDPRYPAFALYLYLGWLQEEVVAALAQGIDPAGIPDAPAPPPG